MNNPLLVTKTNFPHPRARVVKRAALFARLKEGLERNVPLISAPAGFENKALLSAWLAQVDPSRTGVAWLFLDLNDNHPFRFCACAVAAAGRLHTALSSPKRRSPIESWK